MATLDALVEPIINGIWFYILYDIWQRRKARLQSKQYV